MTCPSAHFSAATSAGFYAQLTGLLAGFAFAAMVVILGPPRGDGPSKERSRADGGVLLALIAAFVALVFATLTYSVLAGEDEVHGRAATEELLDGLPFGLAVVMLFHGITALMISGRVESRAIGTGRAVTVLVTPTLTLYYLSNGASDSESARSLENGGCGLAPPPVLGVVLSIALAALMIYALSPRFQPRRWRTAQWPREHQHLAPMLVLSVSVLAAVLDGNIAVKPPDFLLPHWEINAYLAGAFALLAAIGLLLSFQTTNSPSPSKT
jgi:hypothetical protein